MVTQQEQQALEAEAGTVDPEILEEFQNMMDDVAAKQRDPNIAEGTPLGSSDIDGMPVNYKKQSSMHRLGDIPMPDRMLLYKWPTNEQFPVPTSLVFKRLAFTNDDGHRVWSRAPFPDGKPIEYITKTVMTLEGTEMTKRFTSEAAYETFMRSKQSDIWEANLRDEARREREEDREEQRNLAKALLAAAGAAPEPTTAKPAFPTSLIDNLDPDGLKALADEFGIKVRDKRSPEKMRVDLKNALETP